MERKDGLEVLKISIDDKYADEGEDLGIDLISYTSNPAIKVKGVNFTAQTDSRLNHSKSKQTFKDDNKMRIAAPALIPMQIYRDDEWGEYYVEFTDQVVEQIYQKFMKNLNNSKDIFNVEHTDEMAPAYVLESWMVGKDNKGDRSYTEFGIEVPPGSIFVVSQITDEKYYDKLVKEDRIGYSIEGFLGFELSELVKQEAYKKQKNKDKRMDKKEFTDGDQFEVSGVKYIIQSGQPVKVEQSDSEEKEEKETKTELSEDSEKKDEMEGTKKEEATEKKEEVEAGSDKDKEEMEDTDSDADGIEDGDEKDELQEEGDSEEGGSDVEVEVEIDEEKIMEVINPKLEEIYSMIADIKTMIENTGEQEMEEKEEKIEMSIHQRFANAYENYLSK